MLLNKKIKTSSTVSELNITDTTDNNNKLSKKVIGKTKHFPASIKEWRNAIYTFNKQNTKDLPIKTKIIDNVIYSYFNLMFLYDLKKNNKRKRRIVHRDSKKIRRSLNKILLGKSEIKHTNNKSIINIYTLNNEKKILKNKLFRLNLERKISSFYRFFNNPHNKYSNDIIKGIKKYGLSLKNRIIHKTLRNRIMFTRKNYLNILNKFKGNKRKISLYKLRKYGSGKFFSYRDKLILHILKKRSYIKSIFFFSFLKWVHYLFKIKVNIISNNRAKTKTLIIKKVDSKTNILFKAHITKRNFIKRIGLINNLLLSILINSLNGSVKNRVIVSLFKFFKGTYYLRYLKLRLKRETVSLIRLNLLNFNNLKFNQLIQKLRLMLSNILNNKIEFNVINLKYLHMNTDIFTQAISIKLRRKTSRLLLILKRSLRLIKMPESVNLNNITTNKTNFVKNYSVNDKYKDFTVNSFKSKSNKNENKDLLNLVVNNIFFKSKKNTETNKSKFNTNILNTIKHKWTKGIRLEVKGRLTKRYTASRAIFKYMYLGNLRDYNNYNISKHSMTRGDNKSNLQYSFTPSKKRIGSFGVKGWVSTK